MADYSTGQSPLGDQAIEASIVSATGVDASKVSCQLFADVKGKHPIGSAFTETQDVVLGTRPITKKPVAISAIRCYAK
jgi:hypothetical protein